MKLFVDIMTVDEIIDNCPRWFEVHDVDAMLKARGYLSLHIVELGKSLCEMEAKHPKLKSERKLKVMTEILTQSGTVQERESKAHQIHEGVILEEAELEGKIKAYRHRVEHLKELANSLASFINASR